MGNSVSTIKNINFEDMQLFIKKSLLNENTIIINTISQDNQGCLIRGTIAIEHEIKILNDQLVKDKNTTIVIYGMNACDDTILKKYDQLIGLGFINVHIYPGGMFEWLLLQDVYGFQSFPTTSKENDLLKYKGQRKVTLKLLEYNRL